MQDLLDTLDVNCFATDYQSAREKFRSTLKSLNPLTPIATESFNHPLAGPNGESLTCDVAFIGNPQTATKIYVLMSSTHGVEGFAGSAIQVDCLPYFSQMLADTPQLGFIVIHTINPWGFAWLRRSDHEGIDINRNFVDFAQALPQTAEQQIVFSADDWRELLSQADLSHLWQDCGLDKFVEGITYGQYVLPDSLFYGGKAASWSRLTLEQITQHAFISNANRIVVVDLHTGLGPYGYGELINDHPPATPGFAWVDKLFGANAKSVLQGESCSTVKSGLIDYHWYEVIGDRGCFVTLEFGTYEVEQLLTSLLKEQAYQNSLAENNARRDLSNPHVQALRAFFYPAEKSWQQQVLFRGRQISSLAINGILQ
ncbi:MAG: DUF2817 domain-containing protein [Gammaproteobacteria bacterium]|nr:DUF2817 domain-containing protein [Gammaproteobacteria bacterium]